jgi:hypothetical protein
LTEIWNHPGTQGVEVEVADEFQEVDILLHDDRLVSVLEEVADPLVAAIEGSRVSSEEAPHDAGQGAGSGPHQEVEVVRQECPGVDRERPGVGVTCDLPHEVLPILVIPEDDLAIHPPDHHVMKDPGGIQARTARHDRKELIIRLIRLQRPLLREGDPRGRKYRCTGEGRTAP